MMSLIQKVKNRLAERKAQSLIQEGKFNEALGHVKRISSPNRQREFVGLELIALAARAAAENGLDEIHITADRQEYERFQRLVGIGGKKYMIYINPENGLIEAGHEELVKAFIPSTHPLLEYINSYRIE